MSRVGGMGSPGLVAWDGQDGICRMGGMEPGGRMGSSGWAEGDLQGGWYRVCGMRWDLQGGWNRIYEMGSAGWQGWGLQDGIEWDMWDGICSVAGIGSVG